jgi:hypothetical protein
MSEYNNMDLFLEPKTKQYGSHMVMTNVHKQSKTKLVNVDTIVGVEPIGDEGVPFVELTKYPNWAEVGL